MIFGIHMYHERMQVKIEYGATQLLLKELLPLDLENLSKMTVSVHFLSDSWMDSNDIWYTDVS
jgi:hypothetical protein